MEPHADQVETVLLPCHDVCVGCSAAGAQESDCVAPTVHPLLADQGLQMRFFCLSCSSSCSRSAT